MTASGSDNYCRSVSYDHITRPDNAVLVLIIGVGAQPTLGRHDIFCPKNMYEKNNNMPEFYIIFALKISKIPEFLWKVNKISEFHMIFARKMPEFYVIIARKIFFPIFLAGGGADVPPPPSATRMLFHLFVVCHQHELGHVVRPKRGDRV